MSDSNPAVSIAAVPGKRRDMLELARELDDRGYPEIHCPSIGDGLALCEAIALSTERVTVASAISPIYYRSPQEYAATTAFIHEISNGRFRFGIGVAHAPSLKPRGIDAGRPLEDTRAFVEQWRTVPRVGELPPIVLAALRPRMIALAGEIGDGLVFANGARTAMSSSLAALPDARRSDPAFFIGNMIPTCIDDDIEAARAVNRRTLSRYALLPNYRNYWMDSGYEDEMRAVEQCIADGRTDDVGACLSDAWLDDTTIAGPAARVRVEVERWRDAGITTPILVPSSTRGGQLDAFRELFAVYG